MSKNPTYLIQKKMDAVDRRWRWLKFWEYLGATGATFALLFFAIEVCAWREIVTDPTLVTFLIGSLAVGAFVMLLVVCIVVLVAEPRRAWLADNLEKGCPGMLDRMHTLIFLEKMRLPTLFQLKKKIEAQAAEVLTEKPLTIPLSSRLAWRCMAVFALITLLAVDFNARFHPFDKVHAPVPPPPQAKPKNETPFELVPTNATETSAPKKAWGEVRIVDPGRDLKMTKIDVVPLQIEMSASAALHDPVWITSINGGPEVRHDLAAPTEPQYAVYQPLLYLDELKVSDWDVVSYYASVKSDAPGEYASKIYFIEIRPFREDLLKKKGMPFPGGPGDKPKELLDELNDLIKQQMVIMKDTHQFQQNTYAADELRKQDNKKLTDAERDLSLATDHLYGKIVAENENGNIGDILDHLAAAQQQMEKATDALNETVIPEAKQREQGAIAELVASRKSFLKVLTDTPNAFGNGGSGNNDDPPPPTASTKDSLKALDQVTEMHDKDQATLKALAQLNQEQHDLAQKSENAQQNSGPDEAREETKIKSKLDSLIQNNPDLFRAADQQKASAESDMTQAISNLSSNGDDGTHFLDQAAGDLNDLEKVVKKDHDLQQMAEAYKLNKVINQNIQQLGQEKNKAGSLTPQQVKDLADSAERATGTLKEIADNAGGAGSNFGPELSKALSADQQAALHQALDKLEGSKPGPGSQSAAGAAQDNLAQVSKAFQQSQPASGKQGGQPGQGGAPGQGSPGDALAQGSQQLQSLLLAQQEKQPPAADQQQKELNDILSNLSDGLSKDPSPAAKDALVEVQNMQKKKNGIGPPDPVELKKLYDQIQAVSAEAADRNKDKPSLQDITVIDPSKFPSNYRDRIRAYYEQLSAQSQ